jgi:ubiquinone/menaquinone biosynthesis C-methylase UbiE
MRCGWAQTMGYPPAFVEVLARALRLGSADVVADVGCGTGQLTIPLAACVRAAAGIDPEPAMLALAAQAAAGQQVANVTWILGSDRDLPALAGLLGEHTLAAVTIANAIHLMAHQQVFAAARRLLRPGGGLAVIANGTPLWQQPSDWSQALRAPWNGGWEPGWDRAAAPTRHRGSATRLRSPKQGSPGSAGKPSTTPAT